MWPRGVGPELSLSPMLILSSFLPTSVMNTTQAHVYEDLAATSVPQYSKVVCVADAVMANVYLQCPLVTSSLIFNRRNSWLQSSASDTQPRAVHLRIVQKLAVPVVYARNSREYTQVMCDVLETIIEAHAKARFLHRDISLNNIMIDLETSSGILNDWDHSGPSPLVAEPKKRRQRAAFRTGTWQFMSIESLKGPYKIHNVDDDVQSLFWAFLLGGLRHLRHNRGPDITVMFDYARQLRSENEVVWVGGHCKFAFIANREDINALGFQCHQVQTIYHQIANLYRHAYVQAQLADDTQAQERVQQGEGNVVMPSPRALLKIFQDALHLSWTLNALCSNKFASQTYADIDRKLRQTIQNSRGSSSGNVARPSRDIFHNTDPSSRGTPVSDPDTRKSDSPAQGSSLLFLCHRPSQETDSTSLPFSVSYFEDSLCRGESEVPDSEWEDGEADIVIANVDSQCSVTSPLLFNRRDSRLQSSASNIQPRALHLRIVQKRNIPVVYAQTSREYTQVICDVLKTIIEANEKARILHRNISLNNIVIDLETSSGILNDWDHSGPSLSDAAEKPEERRQRAAFRTGTWQFRSIDLLEDANKIHNIDDDVQSLFWAFLMGGLRHLRHNRGVESLDMFNEARQVHPKNGPVVWEGGQLKRAWISSAKALKQLIFQCPGFQAVYFQIADKYHTAYILAEVGLMSGQQAALGGMGDSHEPSMPSPHDLLKIFQSALNSPSSWPLNDMGPNKFASRRQADADRKIRQAIQNSRGSLTSVRVNVASSSFEIPRNNHDYGGRLP